MGVATEEAPDVFDRLELEGGARVLHQALVSDEEVQLEALEAAQ